MPTYDYKCNECGGVREIRRSIHDNYQPVCCEKTMTQVWGATPGVIFNGSGFYTTDK